jgi:transposase-like protein
MEEDTVIRFRNQEEEAGFDLLTDILRKGAKKLLAQAIEAEISEYLSRYSNERLADGKQAVVRNGYLPERIVQTGIGAVKVKIPKTRDRAGEKRKFNSSIIPPYLKRSKDLSALLPALYLKGISTGDFSKVLGSILGKEVSGLTSSTISRLKSDWEKDYEKWQLRDLSHKRYVYIWADGVHFHVRSNDARACMLVMIGVTDMGRKELVAVELGYKENAENWRGMMHDLKAQGLAHPPELVIADGALGLWKAVSQEWPSSKHQRCWVHKSQNVLCKLPKTVQKTAKGYLHDIWQAETKKNALASFDKMVEVFEAKYPKAMQCLTKDKEQMLAFYDFPAVHWHHIRTSNAIESVFSTVRLRTDKIKNCVSEKTLSSLVFKLAQSAEKNWQKIRGFDELKNIIQGINFVDGIKQNMLENSQRYAA